LPSTFFSEFGDFFEALRYSLSDGLLFLGGPFDIVFSLLDIVITTFVIYYLLLILRDSRAWQLLRGILLILIFAFFASAVGLNTVWYLLSRTISILAIAIIVIFQPELRRTLEAVGRNRFKRMGWMMSNGASETGRLVESIVYACDHMSKTNTGALIIIERSTRLGEFEHQENAVHLDADVTSTLLRQIFYSNSPLHDGAVLIRDGRIAAARVHVPLSDVFHLRRDFGLRHRAAVGASELGDTIAVVVSEERGTISVAYDGVLHVLENSDALRSQLQRLLGDKFEEKPSIFAWFRRFRREDSEVDGKTTSIDDIYRHYSDERDDVEIEAEDVKIEANEGLERPENDEVVVDVNSIDIDPTIDEPSFRRRFRFPWRFKKRRPRRFGSTLSRRHRIMLAIISIVIAVFSWLYVQITVNPIARRTLSIPLTHMGVDDLETRGFGVQSLPVPSVEITVHGRQRTLNDIDPNSIIAYIDLSDVAEAGMMDLPVKIKKDTPWYVKTEYQYPTSVSVNVYMMDDINSSDNGRD